MRLRESRLLRNARNGTLSLCAKINVLDPKVIELCGLIGFDAVWICMEHLENDWSNVANQVRAAKLYDMDSIVRVASGGYTDVIKPLEVDATGVMVPHVSTVLEASRAIEWARFSPQGMRRVDGGGADAGFCTIPMSEYRVHANSEKLVVLQIESTEGVENVEEIAALPGVDALLFGPMDFSQSIGAFASLDAPEVIAGERRTVEATLNGGKIPMITGKLQCKDLLVSASTGILNIGSDIGWLTKASTTAVNLMRCDLGLVSE